MSTSAATAARFNAPPFNVSPADYRDHRPLAGASGKQLWENHGWCIRQRSGNRDLFLWAALYNVASPPQGPFLFDVRAATQTLVVEVDYHGDERRRMHDNDFRELGWDPVDLLPADALRIATDAEASTWRAGEREFRAAPPQWTIKEHHAGVDCDVRLDALCPAFWFTGRERDIAETGDRWHMVYARTTGRVAIDGKEVPLDGYACHERHVHLNDYYDPSALNQAPGLTFHNGFGAEVQTFLLARPRRGLWSAHAVRGGEIFPFRGPEQVRLESGAPWMDPRCGLSVPSRWVVTCRSDRARLTLEGVAFARAYYLWSFSKHDVNVLYWWVAEADGEMTIDGGERHTLTRMPYVVHANRAFHERWGGNS